mmetsp:Transcript_20368/g.43093  ORF Transcript_20368/g.43093 Transcript_20368/m.43093 type:complete len:234 (+) Transcript_20368:3380-4081(+)
MDDFFGSFGARSEFEIEGHVRKSIRWIDNSQARVAHRPAGVVCRIGLPANRTGADFVPIGTAVIQDSCRLAECLAIVENGDCVAGSSGGSDRPNIVDGCHKAAHFTALLRFGRRLVAVGIGSSRQGAGGPQPSNLADFTYKVSHSKHDIAVRFERYDAGRLLCCTTAAAAAANDDSSPTSSPTSDTTIIGTSTTSTTTTTSKKNPKKHRKKDSRPKGRRTEERHSTKNLKRLE